jgi:preprotein translocase SecF subunit
MPVKSYVGPRAGRDLRDSALQALILSFIAEIIYGRLRFSQFRYGLAAVLGIVHDVLITVGCFALARVCGLELEMDLTMIAALLTIVGYSINDTIVIFDRIREDLRMGVRGTFRELINQALNQTLSRTIITSGTVFLATLSLLIFGGGPINDFAFTFLVGIITGTYSSIYIASSLVLWWHKGQRPKIGNAQLVVETAAPART